MENVLLAMKPKGNKKESLSCVVGIFSLRCKGRQISLSLVRKSVSTVSPNSTKDKTGTKIQNELALIERLENSLHFWKAAITFCCYMMQSPSLQCCLVQY